VSAEPGLLATLLPAGVVAVDIMDDGQVIALRPGEAAMVAGAGDKRRRDFALGRHCAHLALARLGMTATAMLSSPQGAPLWPDGIVGSITHTHGYAAAIAAPRALYRGLGVDAEPVGGVTEALHARLFDAEERERLMAMAPEARAETAAIMFGAKEAHHKATSPAAPLRFRDLQVTLTGPEILVRDAGGAQSKGAWRIARGLALVLVGLPA
jgi:4'-phosphopantetheinyl transferase EntD